MVRAECPDQHHCAALSRALNLAVFRKVSVKAQLPAAVSLLAVAVQVFQLSSCWVKRVAVTGIVGGKFNWFLERRAFLFPEEP